MTDVPSATQAFREARDLLLRHRENHPAALAEFSWPRLDEFNWALDWFDVIAAEHPDRDALRILADGDAAARISYGEMSARSNQVANWLRGLGARRGDRLLLMLGNIAPLWEIILAAMKLGVVIIPASTLLGPEDVADRVARGDVRHVITEYGHTPRFADVPGGWTRVAVSTTPGATPPEGWHGYAEAAAAGTHFEPDGPTYAADPLLLYFTSGTTAQPKLVEHTHASYPAGHLSTMYWIGLQPGDVHLNISSPGWAKHAWSNVYAPWNAGATALVLGYERFSAQALMDAIGGGVTTFCAPPTVWRMLIQADLSACDVTALRECVAAGEPLNPEVIDQVRQAWGITVRDGYGQTETTAQVGNPPGQPLRPGSMGHPLPGYAVVLVDPLTGEPGQEGEICLDLSRRPLGLMTGYRGDAEQAAEAMRGGYYHTGDVASRDADGYLTFIGRTDDVFKASDYRISPFELENVLIEHEAVAEAAVVPSPDPMRSAVPKAYVTLAAGFEPSADTAAAILGYARQRLSPYKRIRRLEFGELPKTISGKIRRVELRTQETDRLGPPGTATPGTAPPGSTPGAAAADAQPGAAAAGFTPGAAAGPRGTREFWEEDFPELKS
ncbi:MAG: AMP-binding protein [Streptosporangiaceae bacterium]|jgi:acetyl-CoA synthetase